MHSLMANLFQVTDGDLLLTRTGASVGKSYLYRKEDGFLVYAGFLIKIAPLPDALSSEYLFQFFKTECYWVWVAATSMRSGQPGINVEEYSNMLIPLPKLKEQRAIASVLRSLDQVVAELEALVVKQRSIKQAMMQELLTGRTRLI